MPYKKGGCQISFRLSGIYYEKVINKSITCVWRLFFAVSYDVSIGYRNV